MAISPMLCALILLLASTLAKAEALFHLDRSLTYRLDNPFSRNYTSDLVGPSSFFSTNVSNSTQQDALRSGYNATFVSLSDEFDDLFGSNPQAVLAAHNAQPIFFEAGIWVPGNGTNGENGSVWFTADTETTNYTSASLPKIHVLDLSTNQVSQPAFSHSITNPNGGTLYGSRSDHAVLIAALGNTTVGGSIVKVDTRTYKVETLVNSYWGYPFNSPDDVAFARFDQGDVIYFTDLTFPSELSYHGPSQQNNAVWRFDLESGTLVNVIAATDISAPNGVRLNKEGTKLYVSDFSGSVASQKGNATASSNIYVYDLDESGTPYNKRVFGTSIHSILLPDGMKIDDDGRVWTGENGGIVIRSSRGRILGFINPIPLVLAPDSELQTPEIANFALAGDEVVIGADTSVYRVKLTRQIVSPDRVGGA
ncbi:hypothetical protein CBS101457_004932 [Exobasidium rhododendri]|nr:hypothetical protein CBS101457_004932 [Exobasidium rhododendri]